MFILSSYSIALSELNLELNLFLKRFKTTPLNVFFQQLTLSEVVIILWIIVLIIVLVQHNCHYEEECPPCTVLVSKLCMGYHKVL